MHTVKNNICFRIRNIKNQSALDVAVSRGFIDCARWLWLNQWSISITRKQSPKSTPVKQKRVDNEHLLTTTPAKKFFQKSNQDFLLEKSLEKINKEHGRIRPNSSVYLNPTKLYNEVKARPKSSIHYERKIKNHQNTNKRNQASFISTSILPPHIRIPTPSSIPSKYNSRMQVQNPRIDNRFQVKLSEQEKGRSQLLKRKFFTNIRYVYIVYIYIYNLKLKLCCWISTFIPNLLCIYINTTITYLYI